MRFQKNIIPYTLTNIISVDDKLNKAQKDDVIINKSEKWQLYQSIQLQYLPSANYCLHLLHMENNMVVNEKERTIYQFHVGFMLNPELNSNKAFKEK